MKREITPILDLDKNEYLTDNFQVKEFAVSSANPHLVEQLYITYKFYMINIFKLCHTVLQPARNALSEHKGKSTRIISISGYRDKWKLNPATPGASPTSNHTRGEAVDITTEDPADLEFLFEWIQTKLQHSFGELYLYYHADGTPNFIHISAPEWKQEQDIKRIKG